MSLIKMIREEPDPKTNLTYKFVSENLVKTAEDEGWKRADGKSEPKHETFSKKSKKTL